LGLGDPARVIEVAQRVADEKLSVRDTEKLVRARRQEGESGGERRGSPHPPQGPQARELVEELQRSLGTKVRLVDRGGKGTLEIDFFSYEDLDRLLAFLRK